MKELNDGGPAFPFAYRDLDDSLLTNDGLTMRDYFAGQALGSKINTALIGYEDHAPEHRAELIRRLTRDCWEIADAMLKAREVKP